MKINCQPSFNGVYVKDYSTSYQEGSSVLQASLMVTNDAEGNHLSDFGDIFRLCPVNAKRTGAKRLIRFCIRNNPHYKSSPQESEVASLFMEAGIRNCNQRDELYNGKRVKAYRDFHPSLLNRLKELVGNVIHSSHDDAELCKYSLLAEIIKFSRSPQKELDPKTPISY